ncbi:hypothetical protein L208DRAFT_1416147 [Tricholoma matsutake]|nr:hypothetical protein L208DRAFT_1416147 [Tricholoma matsutake 945]
MNCVANRQSCQRTSEVIHQQHSRSLATREFPRNQFPQQRRHRRPIPSCAESGSH